MSTADPVDPADLGYKKQLAEGLAEWRAAEKLTQKQAAAKFAVSPGAYAGWERGQSWPRREHHALLAQQVPVGHKIRAAILSYEERRTARRRRIAHTGALWTISALESGTRSTVPLGNLNGRGFLVDLLRTKLDGAHYAEIDDDDLELPAAEVREFLDTGRADEVAVVVAVHEYGVRATVSFDDGPKERLPRHPQTVEAIALVRAGRTSHSGTLAIHFRHRVGAKLHIAEDIEVLIRSTGLVPEIKPAATEAAVRRALLDNRAKEYKFTARFPSNDRFSDDRIVGQEVGRIETRIYPERRKFLGSAWVAEFLDGTRDAKEFAKLVTFDNKEYDEASVAVELPNGRTRTVNVTAVDERVGHALTYDLVDENGVLLPTEAPNEAILAALHTLLEDNGR